MTSQSLPIPSFIKAKSKISMQSCEKKKRKKNLRLALMIPPTKSGRRSKSDMDVLSYAFESSRHAESCVVAGVVVVVRLFASRLPPCPSTSDLG